MAEEPPKVYRTDAFRVERDGKEHVIFWTVDTSYWRAPLVYVREHDLYAKGSMSRPVTDEITAIDALKQMAALESDARSKHPLADDSYRQHMHIGERYRDAPSWSEHPALAAHKAEEDRKRLRAQKPPGFKLR